MKVPNFAGLVKSRLASFVTSFVVVVVVGAAILVFEPPRDVEARIGRPYISSVSPCNQSDLLTVDVADKRYISRLRISESFRGAPVDLPLVRIQSIEDASGNVYVLRTELQTGVIETIVFDPDGFPVVSAGNSNVEQLRLLGQIEGFKPASDPVLVPANTGFYLFAQLITGAIKVIRIGLDSSGQQFLKQASIDLPSFDLSSSRPGFATVLDDQIVVATGQRSAVRIKMLSEGSKMEGTDIKVRGAGPVFVGTPLLVSTGSDVFAVVSDSRNTTRSLISLTSVGKFAPGTDVSEDASVPFGYEVVAASPRPSETGTFLLRKVKSDAGLNSFAVAIVTAEGGLRIQPITLAESFEPVAVLGDPGVVMVAGSTESIGGLTYVVIPIGASNDAKESATREITFVPDSPECIKGLVGSVNLAEEQAKMNWSNLLSIRVATPLIEGGLLFLSAPFSTSDCVIREDEIEEIDFTKHCRDGGQGYVEKDAAPPAVDLVSERLKIAVAAAKQEKVVTTTTTTLPSSANAVDTPAPEKLQTAVVVSTNCTVGSEVPRPPRLISQSSGEPRYSQQSGRSTIDVVLEVYPSNSSSCYPDEVEISTCIVDISSNECENPRVKTFDLTKQGNELGAPFVIRNVPGRDGGVNRVTAVAVRNSQPSAKSEVIEVEMAGQQLCQPRGVRSTFDEATESWTIKWDLRATNTDCEDVRSSDFVVQLFTCSETGKTAFVKPVEGVYKNEVTIKAVNDPLVGGWNFRGQVVAFQVFAVAESGAESLNPRRQAEEMKCRETTTEALSTVELNTIGFAANAIKSERKLQVTGTSVNGLANLGALTRTLGTSTFESLCLSWQRDAKVVGEEQCVTKLELQDVSREFMVDFKNIGCVAGTWQLLFVPRGAEITERRHNFSVPVQLGCTFVYNGREAPQFEFPLPVKGDIADTQEWEMTAIVNGLGYDVEELGSNLEVKVQLSCNLWNGKTDSAFFPGVAGLVTPIISTVQAGAAVLQLKFAKFPSIRKLKSGCDLIINATPPRSPAVSGRWPVDLSRYGSNIAKQVAVDVRATVDDYMSKITPATPKFSFSRKVVNSTDSSVVTRYTTNFIMENAISCPQNSDQTDFEVSLKIGNAELVKCGNSTNLSWDAISVQRGTQVAPLTSVPLTVQVTVPSVNSEIIIENANHSYSLCQQAWTLNDPCDDPRIPMLQKIELNKNGATGWQFSITADVLDVMNVALSVCEDEVLSPNLCTTSNQDNSSGNPRVVSFNNEWTSGTSLWVRVGTEDTTQATDNKMLLSSVLIKVPVPVPVP